MTRPSRPPRAVEGTQHCGAQSPGASAATHRPGVGLGYGTSQTITDMKKMSASEELAKNVVENHLGDVTAAQCDFNSGQSRHDFELVRNGDSFASMEVTEDRAEADAQWNALGEPLLAVRGCSTGWRVVVERSPSKPNKWATQVLAPFLRTLEEHGTEHTIYADSPSNVAVPPELRDLGYVAAVCDPGVVPGSARLSREAWDRLTSSDELATWITEFTHSDRCLGERAKLHASGFDERHLAIVVPFSPATGRRIANLLATGVQEFGLPSRLPELPSEITHVWLVSNYPGVSSLLVSADGREGTEPATPLSA